MVWKWLSQIFNCKLYNYSNSRDDINETSNSLGDLVKFLKDDDHAIVKQAVEMVKRILEREDGREMVVNTPGMVVSLIDVLNSSSDLITITRTSEILYSLSQCEAGLLSIYQSNGIPVLIQLLSNSSEYKVECALIVLHNFLLYHEGSTAALCEVGGLQIMVSFFKNNVNEKLLTIVIDCLRILAYRNQENKLLIYSNDVPAELVRILNTSSCQSLLHSTTGLLKTLSDCSSNKRAIIEAGGMQVLVKHLNNRNSKLLTNCLLTLRNLADALNEPENVGSFLKILTANQR